MSAQKGQEMIFQIHNGTDYVTVAGFTANSFTINGEPIDITNKDSAGFKEYLEGAGFTELESSGSGVFMDDAAFDLVHGHALAKTFASGKLIVPDYREYTGNWMVPTLSLDGEKEGAVTYNFSLKSTGVIASATI